MKTPDKILFEYAADNVTCFHGHELTWVEFGNCCDDFFKRNYGIRNCYWRLLRANGFSEDAVRALHAMDFLSNELETVLLDPAFKLNMFFKERLCSFVDPKNFLRFETEQEAIDHAPQPDYNEFLKLTDEQKNAVEGIYKRRLEFHITKLEIREHNLLIDARIRGYESVKDEFRPTLANFKKYLECLADLPSIVSLDVVNEKSPTVVSVRSEATPGKRRRFKITLHSLVNCSIKEYDQKTVED